jgi:hypothetical protein
MCQQPTSNSVSAALLFHCFRIAFMLILLPGANAQTATPIVGTERQVTHGPGGRILTNTSVWSPDSQWLVYDVRSDPAGDLFDGTRIEAVHVKTGEVRVLYESAHGACCGVVTHHPRLPQVVFILGPEHPTPDWQYGPNHRQGVVVDTTHPGTFLRLDARDLTDPPTPGALRGGTHVHVWDGAGDWLAFTYNDALTEPSLRDIGIAVPGHLIQPAADHPRNHSGHWYCALVTQTVPLPKPGSDEIKRANEEGWIGTAGYVRSDGTRQQRAIAFQGHVVTATGETVQEVFVVDLPEQLPDSPPGAADLLSAHNGLSDDGRLRPLVGAVQRRLTRTTDRRFPGIQGTRHWLRSSPDGSQIAFLMKDDNAVSQLWTVSPATGTLRQITRNVTGVSSAFTWSPDGRWIAHGLDGRVCLTDMTTGVTHPVAVRGGKSPAAAAGAMQKEACVFSPDGLRIAFVRSAADGGKTTNQICVIELDQPL